MNGKAMDQIEALADQVSKAFGDYVATGFAAMGRKVAELQAKVDRYEALEKRFAGLEESTVRNVTAVQENTAAIYDCLAQEIPKQLKVAVDALPKPIDGLPGKDAEPVDFDAMVKTVLAAIPAPKDGEPGVRGKDAEPVDYDRIGKAIEEVVAEIPKPKDGVDGLSVDRAEVQAMIDEVWTKVIETMPKPRDGVDGLTIVGADGEPGLPGAPGRDALELDVLDGIDEKRSYPRGTFAAHKGGLIRALRSTEPITDGLVKAGWAVLVEGVAEVGVEQGDDLRTFAIGTQLTSGKAYVQKFVVPVMINRGTHKDGADYVRGDVTVWDGSSWHCEIDGTKDEPGNGKGWKIIAMRGTRGKDAVAIKGEPGPPGRPGKDLTQLGPNGAKW